MAAQYYHPLVMGQRAEQGAPSVRQLQQGGALPREDLSVGRKRGCRGPQWWEEALRRPLRLTDSWLRQLSADSLPAGVPLSGKLVFGRKPARMPARLYGHTGLLRAL